MHTGNLTYKEYFRLHGTLPQKAIEELLDVEDTIVALTGVQAHIEEAMGSLTPEDMLAEPVSQLQDLAKRLRGDNRERLTSIIQSIEDFLQCQFNSSDYGRSELREAIKTIAEAKR